MFYLWLYSTVACLVGILLALLGLLATWVIRHQPEPELIEWPDTWEEMLQNGYQESIW